MAPFIVIWLGASLQMIVHAFRDGLDAANVSTWGNRFGLLLCVILAPFVFGALALSASIETLYIKRKELKETKQDALKLPEPNPHKPLSSSYTEADMVKFNGKETIWMNKTTFCEWNGRDLVGLRIVHVPAGEWTITHEIIGDKSYFDEQGMAEIVANERITVIPSAH